MKVIPIVDAKKTKLWSTEKPRDVKDLDMQVYDIISQKIITHSEIVVNFFDYCNMRCVFCPQDHEDKTGSTRSEILSKVDIILDYVIHNTKTSVFLLHLMGGELFHDDLVDRGVLDDYSEFIHQLESKKPSWVEFEYNFITNLVFNRQDKILDFIKLHQLEIAFSYDPTGRFNPAQLELFKSNVEIFKPYIRMFSSVMSKPSIDKIIEGDPYFDYLYQHFDSHWDHLLITDSKYDYLLPSERDIKNFYIHLVEKYPRVINVHQFLEKTKSNKMSCTRGNSLTVFHDNTVPNGCSASAIMKNTRFEQQDNEDSAVVGRFIEQNMCLGCKYFSRCNLTCFMNNEYKNLVRDPDGCPYYGVFEYVENNR